MSPTSLIIRWGFRLKATFIGVGVPVGPDDLGLHTFVVKGVDEKLSPELCGILRQANQLIPDDLRIMAGKELKKRKAHRESDNSSGTTNKTSTASKDKHMDEDDPEELRRANREKQLLQHRSKQQGNSKRRGRR